MLNTFIKLTITVLLVTLNLASALAQNNTADGVFSKAQAASGEEVYQASCASCHDTRFYRDIWGYWQGKALIDFYWRVVAEMPSDNPGSLSDQEYTEIMAYILSELGYPSGETTLDPDADMDKITIAPL